MHIHNTVVVTTLLQYNIYTHIYIYVYAWLTMSQNHTSVRKHERFFLPLTSLLTLLLFLSEIRAIFPRNYFSSGFLFVDMKKRAYRVVEFRRRKSTDSRTKLYSANFFLWFSFYKKTFLLITIYLLVFYVK